MADSNVPALPELQQLRAMSTVFWSRVFPCYLHCPNSMPSLQVQSLLIRFQSLKVRGNSAVPEAFLLPTLTLRVQTQPNSTSVIHFQGACSLPTKALPRQRGEQRAWLLPWCKAQGTVLGKYSRSMGQCNESPEPHTEPSERLFLHNSP